MKDNKKNVFDTFLEKYDEYSSRKKVDIETYYRPEKGKCIFGFVFCLLFFFILIRVFTFSIVYFVILIGDFICLLYFGINLFTKKGIVIRRKHSVPEEYIKEAEEDVYNNYDIDSESFEENFYDENKEYETDDKTSEDE